MTKYRAVVVSWWRFRQIVFIPIIREFERSHTMKTTRVKKGNSFSGDIDGGEYHD